MAQPFSVATAVAGQIYHLVLDNCGGVPGDHAATLTLRGAARLENFSRSPEGTASLKLYGERQRAYAIEASANLIHWTPLSTNFYYNPLMVEDPASASHPKRFYRARLVEP